MFSDGVGGCWENNEWLHIHNNVIWSMKKHNKQEGYILKLILVAKWEFD